MNIEEIKKILKPFIEETIIEFEIEKQMFSKPNGRKEFNKIIRDKVEKNFGIYIWVNSSTKEIVYIGMAGKIKNNGTLGDHSIQNRLLASRYKDKITKKYIQTNDFVINFMNSNKINTLKFYIMYSKSEEPPSFIETLLLYNFYKKNKRLPILNKSF
jgi:hypothetical protein